MGRAARGKHERRGQGSRTGEALDKASAAAKYWDENVGHHLESFVQWNGCPPIQDSHFKLITGRSDYNPVAWFIDRHGPFKNMASIACGDGILERFVADNYPGQITGFDISPGSIERAASLTTNPRAQFEVQDANTAEWPTEVYDAVFAHGGLHHIENLDFCIGQMAKGLKKGGMFYVNDYFGPARFQFTDTQLRLARELLAQIPAKFRTGLEPSRCDPVALEAMDPSEAVRPDHTYDAIRSNFEIVRLFKLGGTLLGPIFGGSCLNKAIVETTEGLEIAARLADTERALIDSNKISSDHLLMVCQKREDRGVKLGATSTRTVGARRWIRAKLFGS